MENLKTKFAPYDDQNIWDLYDDQVFECFEYWLDKTLNDQEIEEFGYSYQCMWFVMQWYLNMGADDVYDINFVFDYATHIYADDDVFLEFRPKPYELAKLILCDLNFKKYIESIVCGEKELWGLDLTATKLMYLKEALRYAENFHPGYLPEHLLEH